MPSHRKANTSRIHIYNYKYKQVSHYHRIFFPQNCNSKRPHLKGSDTSAGVAVWTSGVSINHGFTNQNDQASTLDPTKDVFFSVSVFSVIKMTLKIQTLQSLVALLINLVGSLNSGHCFLTGLLATNFAHRKFKKPPQKVVYLCLVLLQFPKIFVPVQIF